VRPDWVVYDRKSQGYKQVAHNLKRLTQILTISVLLISCDPAENMERQRLISEFSEMEEYRVWITEKSLNHRDSVIHERKTFDAFDSKNRLINQWNYRFIHYQDSTDRIEKIINVYGRDGYINIHTERYDYGENGLLKNILRGGEKIDTIASYEYDENGNQIKSTTKYMTIEQEFEEGHLKRRVRTDRDTKPRISEFEYDSLKRPIVENWVFGDNHQMKTTFEYYEDGKLFLETDSSYTSGSIPNSIVEFRDKYLYDMNDSISEIIKLGRVQGEKDFHIRAKRSFERQVEKRK
jgi:hypothetical protein